MFIRGRIFIVVYGVEDELVGAGGVFCLVLPCSLIIFVNVWVYLGWEDPAANGMRGLLIGAKRWCGW